MEELATSAFGQWNANTVVATAAQISAYVDNNINDLSSTVSADFKEMDAALRSKVILKWWDK